MIIAAACLSRYTNSGEIPTCPFGRGYDHGEAYRELSQFYDIFDNTCDGFFAIIDGKIVFLNREDAMQHAIKCNQVLDIHKNRKRLNSEMLISWEKGDAWEKLCDMDYRMRDFYRIVKCLWRIETCYPDLSALSDEDTQKIFKNVIDSCKFGGDTL